MTKNQILSKTIETNKRLSQVKIFLISIIILMFFTVAFSFAKDSLLFKIIIDIFLNL